MAKLDFQAIAQVVANVKGVDAQVLNLKKDLAAAELKAAYSDAASAALMDAVAESAYKEIIISDGCKWDNQAQAWDKKGAAMLENLKTIAKNGGSYYYNYDNKASVTLDTEARAASFTKALKKEYIRRRKDGQTQRQRKDINEKIRSMYNTLSSMLTGAVLINAVAGAVHCTAAQVNEAIK